MYAGTEDQRKFIEILYLDAFSTPVLLLMYASTEDQRKFIEIQYLDTFSMLILLLMCARTEAAAGGSWQLLLIAALDGRPHLEWKNDSRG